MGDDNERLAAHTQQKLTQVTTHTNPLLESYVSLRCSPPGPRVVCTIFKIDSIVRLTLRYNRFRVSATQASFMYD